MEVKPATPVKKGALITAIILLVGFIIYFSGAISINSFRVLTWIECMLLFTAIICSSVYYANQMNGNVLFGNVFAEGFKTTAVIICLFSLCVVIFASFIFPGMADKVAGTIRLSLEKDNQLSSNQIDEYLSPLKNHFASIVTGFTILFFGVSGAVGSVTGAIIAKKKPKHQFVKQS